MLFEEPTAKQHLSRIVQRVSRNPSWRDDLMQEAVIHLWRIETIKPGHTLSWYLQSCLFHLMNRLSAGRSTDSRKREHQRDLFTSDADEVSPDAGGEGPVHSEVIGREIVVLLKEALAPLDQKILGHLADGLACREIARKLRISHPAVIKHRRRIAALAIRLGIEPLGSETHAKTNGTTKNGPRNSSDRRNGSKRGIRGTGDQKPRSTRTLAKPILNRGRRRLRGTLVKKMGSEK